MKKNNMAERGKGKVEAAAGAIEKAVGGAIGDDKMAARGEAHKVLGNARDDSARRAEHTKGVIEEAVGTAKAKAGHLLGKRGLEVSGKVETLTGKARQAANNK